MPGLGQRKIIKNPLNDKFIFNAISKTISPEKIEETLTITSKHSERERLIPKMIQESVFSGKSHHVKCFDYS